MRRTKEQLVQAQKNAKTSLMKEIIGWVLQEEDYRCMADLEDIISRMEEQCRKNCILLPSKRYNFSNFD